jgi:hypothetical protein
MRFNQTFFVLFPQFELQFSVVENLIQEHYKRKLVGLEYPTADEFQADVEKIKDQLDYVAKLAESGEEEIEVDFKSYDKYVKAQMKFLSNSYLVKSASLLEGLIWGINEKIFFVATICLRQEIEIFGMAHYANCLFEFDPKDKRNRNDELRNLLLGSRIPRDSKFKAIRVPLESKRKSNHSKRHMMHCQNSFIQTGCQT